MAEQEVETEDNPLKNLVQHSLDQDYNKANKIFSDVISVKLNDVLDQEKIKLADQLYNGQPAEEDDTEGNEDQLELDLDNEEDGGDVGVEAESSYEDEETEEESGSNVGGEMEDDELPEDDGEWSEEN